ncbi:hypothetical protein KQX54_002214 [Cotesia glomerata]|uniref:Uncharacterized protein n=1 Tax=Cotesia glomerata TaxID=32391 RepID=A0AAV7HY42_COTGL|nr:hypothetical protein KQX54_002214 [Cotesia glomerata]
MDFMKEFDSKKYIGDSKEIENDFTRIGSESDDHKKIYIGLDHWMEKEMDKTAMESRRATMFINTMTVYIFGTDTLIKSTVTGNTSRRSKDIKDDVEKPLKLPQDGITILRGKKAFQ